MNIIHLSGQIVKDMLPKRRPKSAKWDYGRLLCLAGSRDMPGAAGLACRAASVSGVGLVRLASVEQACFAASCHLMECTFSILPQGPRGSVSEQALPVLIKEAERATAVLVGCGLGVSNDTRTLVRELIAQCPVPLVADADGLNILAEDMSVLEKRVSDVILTPHVVECSRLVDKSVETVMKCPEAEALALARRYGITVVLKGPDTVIASPEGLWKNSLDNPGLAKGGSGDTLAGLMGGLLAQGIPAEHAACAAVWLHSRAGDLARQRIGVRGMTPGDVGRMLPEAFRELEDSHTLPL